MVQRHRLLRVVLLSACASLSVACHHEAQLEPVASPAKGLKSSSGKRVAVVLEENNIPSRIEASAGGHSYTFNNVRQFYEQGIVTALRDQVKEVRVLPIAPNPSAGYDAWVYARVELEMGGLLPYYCKARTEIWVRSPDGKEAMRHAMSDEENFVEMTDGVSACAEALQTSFVQAQVALFGIDKL